MRGSIVAEDRWPAPSIIALTFNKFPHKNRKYLAKSPLLITVKGGGGCDGEGRRVRRGGGWRRGKMWLGHCLGHLYCTTQFFVAFFLLIVLLLFLHEHGAT